jgi:hypothetical protein
LTAIRPRHPASSHSRHCAQAVRSTHSPQRRAQPHLGGHAQEAHVGLLEQRLRIDAVQRVDADPDAGGHVQDVTLAAQRCPPRLQDLARDAGGVFRSADVREQERELVTAAAGHGVARAQGGGEPPCHHAEQLVAHRVTEAVVDALEAVEAQEQDGQVRAAALRRGQCLPEPVVEQRARVRVPDDEHPNRHRHGSEPTPKGNPLCCASMPVCT